MRRSGTAENGFTLIEIMVVLIIIGIALGLTVPLLFASDEERARREGESVFALLNGARDEAAFGNRAILVKVTETALEFFERDANSPDKWHPATAATLATRKFAPAMRGQLLVSGQPANEAAIIFLAVGVTSPFQLRLQSTVAPIDIVGDALGNLRFKAATP